MKTMDKIVNKGKLVIAGIGLTGMLMGGCAAVYEDPIAGGAIGILPKWAQPGGYRDLKDLKEREKNDPWQGTAVVRRDIYPDGTVIFIIDVDKGIKAGLANSLGWDYTDAFIDASKYRKETQIIKVPNIGVVRYIPINQ